MSIVEEKFQNEQQKIFDENAKVLSNFFRAVRVAIIYRALTIQM